MVLIKKKIIKNMHTISAIPGDKSISHRAIIIGSIANNTSTFTNFLFSDDCLNTANIFKNLGINISLNADTKMVKVQGKGLNGLRKSSSLLDVGNSGTAIRLITGILAAQPFSSELNGDSSIQKRPMKRIIAPLTKMGLLITGKIENNDITPPLNITPSKEINGIHYSLPVASAQVKSAILLAGLYANSRTTVLEPKPSRNHTEIILQSYGAKLSKNNNKITLHPPTALQCPSNDNILIPSDFSSAAFFIVLALIHPYCSITLKNIGLNPTRMTLIDVLVKMGGNISIANKHNGIEPYGDITVKHSTLHNIAINESDIPFIIDEIPILTIAGLFGSGKLTVKKAKELRFKESDRITRIVHMIKEFGGDIEEFDDGFCLNGGFKTNKTPHIITDYDHRIAMSSIIASIAMDKEIYCDNIECIKTSFPNFFDIIDALC